jgi:TRAP-type mannitol/chloroaromatic compound transport system permease large subunit
MLWNASPTPADERESKENEMPNRIAEMRNRRMMRLAAERRRRRYKSRSSDMGEVLGSLFIVLLFVLVVLASIFVTLATIAIAGDVLGLWDAVSFV